MKSSIPFFYDLKKTAELAKQAYSLLPPSSDKELPPKWFWRSPEYFMKKHGDLGAVVWARNFSYHALFINGQPVLRLWTFKPNKSRLEVNQNLYQSLSAELQVPSKIKQNKWYYGQFQITKQEEIELTIKKVKEIYGV